jgi:hypothetical protein
MLKLLKKVTTTIVWNILYVSKITNIVTEQDFWVISEIVTHGQFVLVDTVYNAIILTGSLSTQTEVFEQK